ncbi:EAL domain-containing protein [Roseibium sp. M-1]
MQFGKRLLNAGLLAVLLIAGVAGFRAAGLSTSFDRFLWENRFGLDQRPVSGEIVIVDIDARSLSELGVWPLPRKMFAKVTDVLAQSGAQEIIYDVDFSSASNALDDQLFADAIERAGNVSLAIFQQAATSGDASRIVVNRPLDMFLDAAAWPVVVMVPMESDSRIWRNLYGYTIDGTSEISAAAYMGDFSGATAGAFGIDYSIAIDSLARVSLVDVLQQQIEPELFSGKKVIIGASAQELRDLFPVPVYDILPGSVIQALGAETLLQDRAMSVAGETETVLLALFIFLLLMMTKIDGWALKVTILALSAVALELIAFVIQKSVPVLVPTASAHILLLLAASCIVLRELGFHKLLSHLATVGKRNSERMLGLVFDDSFDAIVVMTREGQITAASRTARVLFASEALVGKTARSVLPEELVLEAFTVLEGPADRRPIPKVMVVPSANGKRQFIEYVVTRSERTIVPSKRRKQTETQLVACLTCRDVTEERESAERLEYLARFDPITGLLNRGGFEEELARQVATLRRGGQEVCLLQFAIANLDQIIASLGFSYGDQVRQSVATRLKSHLSTKATWSAVTADVFAGFFPCEPDQDLEMVEALQHVIGEDYKIEGARISVQLKFGYVVSDGQITPDNLLKKSGNALAKVRRDARAPVLAFRPEMDAALQRRRQLETELFKAIVRDELHMAYQPLVRLSDRSIFGVEALLRWDHRELGPISPAEFVPIAEENGYIVELGAWALNRGMKEALTWAAPLRLSINISAIQFSRGNLVGTVAEALERTRFPSERLDLEITESLFIDESLDLKFCMEELKALGCSISLDDFGTGYSSLGYIPKYPFSKIKLDRSFVRQTISSKQDVAVIEAVLHLARGYNMSVIVEGIETADQAARLLELGCQQGQGYLFGRPMSSANLMALLLDAA